MNECVECGTLFERPSKKGPPPRRCLECKKPGPTEAECLDCGQLIARKRKVPGALAARCSACTARHKNQQRNVKYNTDPVRRAAAIAAAKERYRRVGPRPRTDEMRAKDLAAYYRRVSTPEGRERMSKIQRAENIKKKYGLTMSDFDAKLTSQQGRCAICGSAEARGKYGIWHVDHDHDTGTVRGLLCNDCNLGLGRFFDDPARLMAAVEYLSLWGRPVPSSST